VIIRAILAVVLAFSIAMLPAIGGAAVASQSSVSSTSVSNGQDGMPCNQSMDDCKSSAGCALKCFNFSDAIVPELLPPRSDPEPSFVPKALRSHASSPPFRPPPN